MTKSIVKQLLAVFLAIVLFPCYAQESTAFKLQVEKDKLGQFRVTIADGQLYTPDDYIYGMWLNKTKSCNSTIQLAHQKSLKLQKSQPANTYLCLLHSNSSLGSQWEEGYRIYPDEKSDFLGPKDPDTNPPKPKSPKGQLYDCVMQLQPDSQTAVCQLLQE